jgi:anti-sigma factor RsiW
VRHSRANARLNDFVEGDLRPEERARVAAHVAECDECSRDLAELRATVSLLQRLPDPELPRGFTAAVMARVRAGEAERQGFRSWLRRLAEPAIAVPLAASVAGLAVFVVVRSEAVPGAGAPPAASTEVAREQPATQDSRLTPTELADNSSRVVVPQPRFGTRGGMPLGGSLPVLPPGQSTELQHLLLGAGHPHSRALAGQLEPTNLALVDWSPR